ncbi:hypothetical protein ACW5UC_24975 [Priestia aryabhattai]|uniref:hypothetical protein n=1 Tax=Priestia megaterium TaxID=1404 RepID=UPI003F96B337
MEEQLVLLSLNKNEMKMVLSALIKANIATGATDEDLMALLAKVGGKASEFSK